MTNTQADQIEQLTKFMVIGPGFFGRGDTLQEAKKNCMKVGCRAKDKMIAYAGSEDLSIENGYVVASVLFRIGEL